MKLRPHIALVVLLVLSTEIHGQSINVPLSDDFMHKVERYRILRGENADLFHPSFKPYLRSKAVNSLASDDLEGEVNNFNKDYILMDSWEYTESGRPEGGSTFLSVFYQSPVDFFSVQEDDFALHINPVIHFEGGAQSDGDELNYINTRGVEIRGMVDNKLGFYSFIGENQMRVPTYVDNYIGMINAIPHEGFWKNFKTNGYDFFTARGYLSFQATEHINLQFGYDRHKIGQGVRSMLLSDFAPPNLYVRMQTNIWKFNYTNLITQLTEDNVKLAGGRYPTKYLTLHHLSLNLGSKVNIGLFEAIMSGGSGNGGFQVSYLNPIIFYRAIEQQNGSSDNAMIGMDAEWIVTPGISVYGQLLLDEFLLSNIREGNGWWANKAGLQLGINYYDALGINNLDITIETNRARPYTYSHSSTFGSYSHFRQSLAHPWGANFKESLLQLRYQPIPRLDFTGLVSIGKLGRDGTGENWGGNILKDYNTREMDFQNKTTQGILSTVTFIRLRGNYMLKHNLFLEGRFTYRNEDSEDDALDLRNQMVSLGLRLNIASRDHEF